MAKRAKSNADINLTVDGDPVAVTVDPDLAPAMVSVIVEPDLSDKEQTEAPKEPIPAFLPDLPTIIVAGTELANPDEIKALQSLPVNIIVLNHAICQFEWEPNRVIWAVYDEPCNFSEDPWRPRNPRSIIVPEYVSQDWIKLPDANVQPYEYQFQNIRGNKVELFSWGWPVHGHNNCICGAISYALLNGSQNVYLYDAQLVPTEMLEKDGNGKGYGTKVPVRRYKEAFDTVKLWAWDKKIKARLYSMNPRSPLASILDVVTLNQLQGALA